MKQWAAKVAPTWDADIGGCGFICLIIIPAPKRLLVVGLKMLHWIFILLTAKPGGQVKCQYISAVDKVVFVDEYAVGCRKDLNGILLLDTALQTPVAKQDDVVQLELPVTEVS